MLAVGGVGAGARLGNRLPAWALTLRWFIVQRERPPEVWAVMHRCGCPPDERAHALGVTLGSGRRLLVWL